MNIAGTTVRPEAVQLLAALLDGDLAAKLERAVANDNQIVAVSLADRQQIVAALADQPSFGLSELHSVLVKQLAQHQKRAARDVQIRDQARARAQSGAPLVAD